MNVGDPELLKRYLLYKRLQTQQRAWAKMDNNYKKKLQAFNSNNNSNNSARELAEVRISIYIYMSIYHPIEIVLHHTILLFDH